MTRKKNLGIDIDGCLNRLYIPLARLIRKYYKVDVDITHYDIWDQLDVSNKEKNEFMAKHGKELKVMPERNCQFFLRKLSKRYNLCIITARPYNYAKQTVKWLKVNNIPYNDILFKAGTKVDACKYMNVAYMIDDSPWNIRSLNRERIPCLIFDRPYNRTVRDTEYITRIKNWKEIYWRLNNDN